MIADRDPGRWPPSTLTAPSYEFRWSLYGLITSAYHVVGEGEGVVFRPPTPGGPRALFPPLRGLPPCSWRNLSSRSPVKRPGPPRPPRTRRSSFRDLDSGAYGQCVDHDQGLLPLGEVPPPRGFPRTFAGPSGPGRRPGSGRPSHQAAEPLQPFGLLQSAAARRALHPGPAAP